MRFLAPPAHEAGEIHWPKPTPGFCLPELCSAFRISHPLDGLLPPSPFRPCFMPVALMGFDPFRAFPSHEAVAPLDARSPHAVVVSPCRAAPPDLTDSFPTRVRVGISGLSAQRVRRVDRLQGLAPRESPLRVGAVLPAPAARCSPGVVPLQGIARVAPGRPLPDDLLP